MEGKTAFPEGRGHALQRGGKTPAQGTGKPRTSERVGKSGMSEIEMTCLKPTLKKRNKKARVFTCPENGAYKKKRRRRKKKGKVG